MSVLDNIFGRKPEQLPGVEQCAKYWATKEEILKLEQSLKQLTQELADIAEKQNLWKGKTATFPDGTKLNAEITQRIQGQRGKELLESVKEFVNFSEDYIKESLDESKLIKDSKKHPEEFQDLFSECGLEIEEITTIRVKK